MMIFIAILIIIDGFFKYDKYYDESNMKTIIKNEDAWYSKTKVIAHACGQYNKYIHSNSVEAMENFLKKTEDNVARIAEVDFNITNDDKLVCCHLWSDYNFKEVPSYKEFMEYNKVPFSQMDIEDIIKYMKENNNLYIMVDTKVEKNSKFNIIDIAKKIIDIAPDDLKDRFVFQLYKPEQKEELLKIYDFSDDNLIFSLYKNKTPKINKTLKICNDYGFKIVLFKDGYFTDESVKRLIDKNIVICVYTINEKDRMNYLIKNNILCVTDILL